MITDGQVRVAIQVLRAYVDGELRLDDDLLDGLEKAIAEAGNKQMGHVLCEIEPEPSESPLTMSW